jgi:hypothetical protein
MLNSFYPRDYYHNEFKPNCKKSEKGFIHLDTEN